MKRSMLFVPASNSAMLTNADVFDADSIIFDLEDAVSTYEKDSARLLLNSYLSKFDLNCEVVVRINGMDTALYMDDLNAVVCDNIDAIMLPKTRTEDVIKLSGILTKLERTKKMLKEILIIPIIELAISVIELNDIMKQPRVSGCLLGGEDFARDMQINRTSIGNEIFYLRSLLAITAKAYGKDAIDTPFTDTRNNEGLIADISTAKSLGLNAKACIHPNQVEYVNKLLAPSPDEIIYAQQIVEASQANINGVFSLNGKMVDKPVIERAKAVIARAAKFNLL